MFETKTPKRRCTIRVTVGDILATNCDIIVNPTNSKLQHEGGLATTIAQAAGDEFLQECREFIQARKTLPVAGILSTTSGDLRPRVKAVINTDGPNTSDEPFYSSNLLAIRKLQETFLNVLKAPDELPGVISIAIPAISGGILAWTPGRLHTPR